MPVTYPISAPSLDVQDIEITAEQATGWVESPFSFKGQSVEWPGERWRMNVNLPPMQSDVAEEWVAFLLSLKGQTGSFTLRDPAYAGPRGAATTDDQVRNIAASGATIVTCKGGDPSATGYLLRGDYVRFGVGAGARLHKVLEDTDTDGVGNYSIEIWPSLRSALAIDDTVAIIDPYAVWRLDTNAPSWSIGAARFYGISFSAVEVV